MIKHSKCGAALFAVPRILDTARDVQVGSTPFDVVYEEDSLRLLRYRRDTPAAYAEPVLVCYALVNRPYIVDLQPDRSVVRQFLDRGFDIYLIDWGVPSAADRSMKLHDYIDGLMKNCVDVVIRKATTPNLHLVGYCMGGTMSAIFAARYPELLKTLTLMTAPIDFSVGGEQSLTQFWSDPKYFDVDSLIDAYGNVPAEFLQASFQMMKPVQNYFLKYVNFFEKMDDPRFVENYFAMEKWTNDNIPVAGETFREFVKKLYQRNELVKGEFRLSPEEDEPVQLRRITCPLMLLTAKSDHLVPPSQTEGIVPLRRLDGRQSHEHRRRAHRLGGQHQGPQEILARGDPVARQPLHGDKIVTGQVRHAAGRAANAVCSACVWLPKKRPKP